MQVSNILKVIDIESVDVKPEFINWLNKEIEPVYRDNEFKEHLFNATTIIENQEDPNNPYKPKFLTELKEISALCFDNEAGYFRITQH